MSTAVTFQNVTRAFGDLKAVDGVDLEIRDGEFFTLLGPSGSACA
jgi:putative spermidine/putrescine transport system ATP-binding protein